MEAASVSTWLERAGWWMERLAVLARVPAVGLVVQDLGDVLAP